MNVTTDAVWRHVGKKTFAVISWVTPAGEPRSAGIVYRATGRRVYVGVDTDSWKARHIAASGRVSVTVLVRRGGLLSLFAQIPPATITFHGTAVVHSEDALPTLPKVVEKLLPPGKEPRDFRIIEIRPDGDFVTYGIGVALPTMLKPEKASGRAPV
jgi:Pyridoxamine 5'-phosphate oxidase